MTDEILTAAANGDTVAFERIVDEFGPLIKAERNRAVRYSPDFAGYSDEIGQEALMALYNAVMTFDPEKHENVTFGKYAKVCVRNRIVSYLRKLGTQIRRQKRAEESEKDRGKHRSADSPEELLMALESNEKLKAFLEKNATEYEKKVFYAYLEKKSVKAVASALGKDEKSVSNAIYRVKAKIKKLFL